MSGASEGHSPSSCDPNTESLSVEMSQDTICCVHDAIDMALLDGDTVTARVLLRKARHMAERMECRLLRYRRSIEVLGFKRDNAPADQTATDGMFRRDVGNSKSKGE